MEISRRHYFWSDLRSMEFLLGIRYDYTVNLFTYHFFAKVVQLMKPQLRFLQWKQTLCVYIYIKSLFSSIIKVIFFLCFSKLIFLNLKTLQTLQPDGSVVAGLR